MKSSNNKILQVLAIIPAWVTGLGVVLSSAAYLADAGGHVPLGAVLAILFALATMFFALIGLFASLKTGKKSWGWVNLVLLCAPAMLWFSVSAEPAQPGRRTDTSVTQALIQAAVAQTSAPVTYDGSYRRIPYPGGDVPANIGVCTDVIVRAYRAVGVDLQVRVHEDMNASFGSYPRLWGLSRADSNIDHRRVPNLQTYFRRRGAQLSISRQAGDYLAGDMVTWILPGNLPHIGLVTDRRSPDGERPLIVHNIGRGPEIEDMLFAYPISGHYRYRADR